LRPAHGSVVTVLADDQKMAVLFALGCTVATTNPQPKPDAEPETADSAKSFGR